MGNLSRSTNYTYLVVISGGEEMRILISSSHFDSLYKRRDKSEALERSRPPAHLSLEAPASCDEIQPAVIPYCTLYRFSCSVVESNEVERAEHFHGSI